MQSVVLGSALFALSSPALAAEEVTVPELVEHAPEYAGDELIVEGELVGDYGFRDDGWMWTQLNGDTYARDPLRDGGLPSGGNVGIGIRMPTDMAESLDPPGGYRHRGPIVRVEGVWKHNDPERQGETFFEVESIVVVAPGRPLSEDVSWPMILMGFVLVVGAGSIWLTRRRE